MVKFVNRTPHAVVVVGASSRYGDLTFAPSGIVARAISAPQKSLGLVAADDAGRGKVNGESPRQCIQSNSCDCSFGYNFPVFKNKTQLHLFYIYFIFLNFSFVI